MNCDDPRHDPRKQRCALEVNPSFIWPDARIHKGQAFYEEGPPARGLFADADLISGLLVGAADGTSQWGDQLLRMEGKRRVWLVLVLFPAGPTREEHLRAIERLCVDHAGCEKTLQVRLIAMSDHVDEDCRRVILPPTVVQAHNTQTGRTVISIGSVGDAGHDSISVGSLNFVFKPDDGLRDAWRQWFQYVLDSAAPLTADTLQIPHLVPAKGDPEASRLWQAFELACQRESAAGNEPPKADPETGELKTDANALQIVPWDEGKTALEPLAQVFQQVYTNGWLVTVDEATRIRPLTIPMKATLLGQQSERTIGALKQKQSFSLRVLDDAVNKDIEKCRTVTDLMELLTYPLSQGNRWLPDAAKELLEKELTSRNEQGQKALRNALGGNDVAPETAKVVIEEQLKSKSEEVQKALWHALGDQNITPDIAKGILEKQLKSGNEGVQKILRDALSAEYINQFIAKRTDSIRKDLNEMYRQLGQGSAVPDDKLSIILAEVNQRLKQALDTGVTPRAVYNRIGAPDLTAKAPDENWNQPFSLLMRYARILRESLTDSFFPRRFTGLSFSEDDFRKACDAFGDVIVAKQETNRAKDEQRKINELVDAEKPSKEKCQELWRMIRGEQPEPGRSTHGQRRSLR
jgi:hypothetical protein